MRKKMLSFVGLMQAQAIINKKMTGYNASIVGRNSHAREKYLVLLRNTTILDAESVTNKMAYALAGSFFNYCLRLHQSNKR